jgi:hypothetical protein
MELDFSKKIKELLALSEAAKRGGPKSSAQTPAKPSEKKKGSSKNKSGSAGGKGGSITFSEKVITSLKNKVKEHNEKHSKKVTLGQLKKIYRRGAGAFSSSHRPGKTRGQWAFANIEFDIAHLDLVMAGANEWEQDDSTEDLEYTEAEKKTLNKPFRLKDGKKKYGVYVKNPKTGNVIMVKFGDPNMEIKRDDPARRRSFRARHKCDTAKDKTTPRYWSCRFWSKKPVSKMVSNEVLAWDEEEVYSEWVWDDEGFADHQDLLNAFPFLESVREIIEEEEI